MMTLWTNFLAESIDAKRKRFRLTHPAKRGQLLMIGGELMLVKHQHRDGSITVERGIEAVDHRILDSAPHGDPKDFASPYRDSPEEEPQ